MRYNLIAIYAMGLSGVLGLAGCTTDSDSMRTALQSVQQVRSGDTVGDLTADPQAAIALTAELLEDAQGDHRAAGDDLAHSSAAPYPDRKNPFEFAMDIDFDLAQGRGNDDSEIKLFGFVGDQQPKAIINIGGRTHLLAAGEKWGGLEVVEISPPNVRIKSAGVLRVWSILGQRDASPVH